MPNSTDTSHHDSHQLNLVKNAFKQLKSKWYIVSRYFSFVRISGLINDSYDHNLALVLDYALINNKHQFIIELNKAADSSKSFNEFNTRLIRIIKQYLIEPQGLDQTFNIRHIKKYLNRYFDAHNLEFEIRAEENIHELIVVSRQELEQLRDTRKANREKKFWWAYVPSRVFTGLVAAPEGALPLFGSGKFNIKGVSFIGMPAFQVNYGLFLDDIYKLFKSLLFLEPSRLKSKRVINQEEEQSKDAYSSLNIVEKFILYSLLYITSACLGVLYFNSIYIPFSAMLYGLSATAALGSIVPWLFGVSVFFGLVVFVSNLALLKGYVFDSYIGLTQGDYNKQDNITEDKKDILDNKLVKYLLYILVILTTVFVQTWLCTEIVSMLSLMLGLTSNMASIIAIPLAILSAFNGVFYGKNVYDGLKTLVKNFDSSVKINELFINIKNFTLALPFNVLGLVGLGQSVSSPEAELGLKHKQIHLLSILMLSVIGWCCYQNAFGVAQGVAASIGIMGLKDLAYALVSFGSFSANFKASAHMLETTNPYLMSRTRKPSEEELVYVADIDSANAEIIKHSLSGQPLYYLYGFQPTEDESKLQRGVVARPKKL